MAQVHGETFTGVSAFEGCPDPTAGRAVIIPAGAGSNICHRLIDHNGDPISLAAYRELDQSRVIVANVACTKVLHSVELTVANFPESPDNVVCFDLPEDVAQHPGIYVVQLAIRDMDRLAVSDRFMLSVEHSLLMDQPIPTNGPLTLGEIRMAMRDYAAANIAWESVEFSDAEILQAILQPVALFNETQPRCLSFRPENFPFKHHWLRATTGYLLRTAGFWYLRNARNIKYGDNKTEDDKEKSNPYFNLGENMLQDFANFAALEQSVANLGAGWASFGGTYH